MVQTNALQFHFASFHDPDTDFFSITAPLFDRAGHVLIRRMFGAQCTMGMILYPGPVLTAVMDST